MSRHRRLTLSLSAGLVVTLAARIAPAQASGQSVDLHFDGTISVPLSIKSVHPDVNYVQMSCLITPAGGTGNQGIVWNDNPNPGSAMSGGQWNGTLTAHFTAHRATTFTAGEVWSYECDLDLLKKASAASGASDGGMPGAGPSFKWWAQLASGNARIQGTFTLQ
jgi:hypothetical protein